jgi:hypothetical protein
MRFQELCAFRQKATEFTTKAFRAYKEEENKKQEGQEA